MRGEDSTNKNGNREQEISYISRSLKALAKELNIPIIALAQLSRDVEKRGGDKKPQLSDLRESGSIEQDADIVGFIWRPDYYKLSSDVYEHDKSMAEIMISKHRNGRTDNARVRYVSHLAKFENYEENYYPTDEEQGPKTVTLGSKVNTDSEDTISKTDMYQLGKTVLKKEEDWNPEDDDTETGANITEDGNPWE